MSRKHRRITAPDDDLSLKQIQDEISEQIRDCKSAERRDQEEWLQVEHLPRDEAFAYINQQNRNRRGVMQQLAMSKCQMPDCEKPSLNLMGHMLGICLAHGFDVATYFDVTGFELQNRDERKAQLLAQRRFMDNEKRVLQERAAESRRITPGWIYYVLIGDRIKIGYSTDPRRRLRSYPPGSPLLAMHPGTKQLETDMHAKFVGSRAAGREWFLDTPELRDHIKQVIAEFGEPDRARYEHHGTGRNKSRLKAS